MSIDLRGATKDRLRILLLVFFILLSVAGASGYLLFDSYKNAVVRDKQNDIAAVADLKVKAIVQWLGERRDDAESISVDSLLADEVQRWFQQAAPDTGDGAATARLDLETLKNTVCMLDELVRNKFQLFITVPLHFETLASAKFRDIYLDIARRVPRALRTFLVFEMVGLPDGVPQSSLIYFANSLKPFCGLLLIRTGLDRRDFERFVGIGAHAVGIDMGSVARPESEVFAELNRFVVEAERCRLWTYVHGISTSSVAVGAIAAGVRYVDCRRVHSSTETPAHIRRFGWEDYYSIARGGSAARPR